MRESAADLLEQAEKNNALYIFYRSQPKAVLMGINQYKKIMDLLEDYFDSLKAREYEKINKDNVDWHSFDELKEKIKP